MDWVLRILILHLLLCGLPVFVGSCVLAMEQGKPIRITRTGVSWFFREWAAHVVIVPLLFTGWWPTLPRSLRSPGDLAEAEPSGPNQADRTPVLLVHGYGRNRACFRFLSIYLRTRGWTWVWAPNHRPWSSPIPVFARNLERSVELLLEASGAERVDIVAHSMGGVVAAWYLAKLGGASRVRRLVTLGTPWSGSTAHVFALRREGRDFSPQSTVIAEIQDLRHDIVAICSDSDPKIFPGSSARHPHARLVEFADLGHLEMLMSARVFRAVVDALAAPSEDIS
jgi:pimeloyl-ACP methyl ester carboxylesterase